MMDDKLQKLIDDRIKQIVPDILKGSAFTARKLTDIPTDALQVVSRKYVTLNGASDNRPTASVQGQFYLDMTLASGRGKPIWWNGTGFIDSDGNYV